MSRRLEQIEGSIARYLGQIESADRREAGSAGGKVERLEEKIGTLREEMQRLDREPERMRVRRSTAEHPFGTLKSWMGSTHFQMRTLPLSPREPEWPELQPGRRSQALNPSALMNASLSAGDTSMDFPAPYFISSRSRDSAGDDRKERDG